jgi:hypothetical protein
MAVPKSPVFEGRFGRMFRNLPIPRQPREALIALGKAMPEEKGSGARRTTEDPPRPTPRLRKEAGRPCLVPRTMRARGPLARIVGVIRGGS